jgi:hypothetical protein
MQIGRLYRYDALYGGNKLSAYYGLHLFEFGGEAWYSLHLWPIYIMWRIK